MVTINKHEWHSVDRHYNLRVTYELLEEIYPDLEEADIKARLEQLVSGDLEVETLIEDALQSNVDLDWDFVDDDWWSDRKGGYDITYSVEQDDDDDSDDDSPQSADESDDSDETASTLLATSPPGVYTIKIWSRTREIGVHPITKEQWEYWSDDDNSDNLSEVLNSPETEDDLEVPEGARFGGYYNDFQDHLGLWGFDIDDTIMVVLNSDDEEVYRGSVEDFVQSAHGDGETYWEATEEIDELYPHYLPSGYWLTWTQGGKGSAFCGDIDTGTQEFDPRLLRFRTWDVEGTSVVTQIEYNGVIIGDRGMDADEDNWRGQWSDFEVHAT